MKSGMIVVFAALVSTLAFASAPASPKTAYACHISSGGSSLSITVLADADTSTAISASWKVSGPSPSDQEWAASQIQSQVESGDDARKDENLSNLLSYYGVNPASVGSVVQYVLSPSSQEATWLFNVLDTKGATLLVGFAGQGGMPVICDK